LQLNVVSFDVPWSIWNNRNNIVFNQKPWSNMKQVWQLALPYLSLWRIAFKGQDEKLVNQFIGLLIRKLKVPLSLVSEQSAPLSAGSLPGSPQLPPPMVAERPRLTCKLTPEDADSVHVVIG
jgi:hypothetical protein